MNHLLAFHGVPRSGDGMVRVLCETKQLHVLLQRLGRVPVLADDALLCGDVPRQPRRLLGLVRRLGQPAATDFLQTREKMKA